MSPNIVSVDEADPKYVAKYRSIIGALIYLSVLTRPDIAYAVSACASFMSNPTVQHEKAALRILRYLKGTTSYSLKYFATGKPLRLTGYVDANFMGDHDSRSVGGHIFSSGNGIISWQSKRQSLIATSTGHAESNAFFSAVRENVYERKMVEPLPFDQIVNAEPTTIYGDNSACIELMSHTNEKVQRTKHWRMNWNWLHEERETLKSYYPSQLPTEHNLADMLTKPMGATTLLHACTHLNLIDV